VDNRSILEKFLPYICTAHSRLSDAQMLVWGYELKLKNASSEVRSDDRKFGLLFDVGVQFSSTNTVFNRGGS